MQESVFPSIFEYSFKHKEAPEDRTTSIFFGKIGKLPSSIQNQLLLSMGIARTSETSRLEGIKLWYTFQVSGRRSREVDAVLYLTDMIVLVEVKISSPLDKNQLVDELKFGEKELKIRGKTCKFDCDNKRRFYSQRNRAGRKNR